jgi:hypothetical protein
MIPFAMVVINKLSQSSPEMALTEGHHPIEALVFDRPHEALRIRIAVGRLERRLHEASAGVGQGPSECGAPLGVTVTDEDAESAEDAIIGTR